MDALHNQIVERKTIELICERAVITDQPFQPQALQTTAIAHAIAGHQEDAQIPEAQHAPDATPLRQPVERL
jgi:hypothetical protein